MATTERLDAAHDPWRGNPLPVHGVPGLGDVLDRRGVNMEVSENLMAHVRAELERLEYGSVTIEVVNGRTADVVTQRRLRFNESGRETPPSGRCDPVQPRLRHG